MQKTTTTLSPERLISSEAVGRALVTLLITASLILVINQYTDIDEILADIYFDAGVHDFTWRNSWFAAVFMHVWVKNLIIVAGVAVFGITLLDLVHPMSEITPLRRTQLRVFVLTMLLAPLTVAVLKHYSSVHCPWDIDRYGGSAPLLRLFDRTPPHWNAGRCFPAGQASTGMWLVALAVFWLPHQPRRAFHVFLGGLGAGLALGWVQQMRGAHFLTHTLATAWVCSAIFLVVLVVAARWPRPAYGGAHWRIAS